MRRERHLVAGSKWGLVRSQERVPGRAFSLVMRFGCSGCAKMGLVARAAAIEPLRRSRRVRSECIADAPVTEGRTADVQHRTSNVQRRAEPGWREYALPRLGG